MQKNILHLAKYFTRLQFVNFMGWSGLTKTDLKIATMLYQKNRRLARQYVEDLWYNIFNKEELFVRDKNLVKLLKQNGWIVVRIQGSHHVLQKGDKTEVVPVHGKDVPTGLLNKILKRAGLK